MLLYKVKGMSILSLVYLRFYTLVSLDLIAIVLLTLFLCS